MYFKIEDAPQKEIIKKGFRFRTLLSAFFIRIKPKTAKQERWFALSFLLSIVLIFIGTDLVVMWQNQRMMIKSKIELVQLQERQANFELNLSPFRLFLTHYFVNSQWANIRAFERLLYHWGVDNLSLQIHGIYKSADEISWTIEGQVARYQDIAKLETIAQSLGWQSEVIWQDNDNFKALNGQSIRIIVIPINTDVPNTDIPLLTLRQDNNAN